MTTDPITFAWEGTDNPNDPRGVARFECDGINVSFVLNDFATASRLSYLIKSAYQRGKSDAIDRALHTIPQLLNRQRYD
jgi:hypothetical protein